MSSQHKVLVNSANRISGTQYDFTVNISIANLLEVEKLKFVKIESSSIINSTTTPASLCIATNSLSFPYSYDTNLTNENVVIGNIPYKEHDASFYYHFASAQDNFPIYSSNIPSVLKSNTLNFRLVNRSGVLMTTMAQDFSFTLVFTES